MEIYWLVRGVLSVWRLTHLLQAEDGPWEVVVKLRRAAGSRFFGDLMDCFYCLSLWISVPFSWWLAGSWSEGVMLWRRALLSYNVPLTRRLDMACCGKRRKQMGNESTPRYQSSPGRWLGAMDNPKKAVVLFEYKGNASLTIHGLVSGKQYSFERQGDIVEVDERDRHWMLAVPSLKQL